LGSQIESKKKEKERFGSNKSDMSLGTKIKKGSGKKKEFGGGLQKKGGANSKGKRDGSLF